MPDLTGAGKYEPDSYIPIVSFQRAEVKLLVEVDSLCSLPDDSDASTIYILAGKGNLHVTNGKTLLSQVMPKADPPGWRFQT